MTTSIAATVFTSLATQLHITICLSCRCCIIDFSVIKSCYMTLITTHSIPVRIVNTGETYTIKNWMSIHTVICSVVSSSSSSDSSSTLCCEYKHWVTFDRIACLTRILEVTGSNPLYQTEQLDWPLHNCPQSLSSKVWRNTTSGYRVFLAHQTEQLEWPLRNCPQSLSQHQYSLRVIYNSNFINHKNNKTEFEVKLCLQSWR